MPTGSRSAAQFTVALQLDPAISANGAIREIALDADAATRTRRVKIALDNPPATFRLGSTITARLAVGADGRAGFPPPPSSEGRQSVRLDRRPDQDAMVATRAIEIASREGDSIEVRGGLEPPTRVVTAGAHSLSEGQSVKFEPEAAP